MVSSHQFSAADYGIFGATLLVSIGIGLYHALAGGRQRTTSEYLVGNRNMSVIPVAISLLVSFESSIMMLGTPAEIYVYGLQWAIALPVYAFTKAFTALTTVPLMHPLKLTSAFEYLELRFESRAVRLIGTSLSLLSTMLYMGIVLYGPALALDAVTGFPIWGSIVLVAVASVVYTSIGGLKAVVWTDVFQCFVMFTGVIAILIKGAMTVGGVSETWRIANEGGRINMLNFDPDPTTRHTFWNLVLGSFIKGLWYGYNQTSIQRMSATPTVWAAQKVFLLTAPAYLISMFLACCEGITAFAYYTYKGCDPLASDQIANPNQIIPYMVMDIFREVPGMPGLFLASLFSASLSTLSSGLNAQSALVWHDLIKPHTKPMSEFKATILAKLSVCVFGVLAIGVAFMVSLIGGTLIQITTTILSSVGSPLTGLFLLGSFCPWANAKGGISGALTAMIFVSWIAIGQYTSSGVRKAIKLPDGPTDFCWNITLSNYTLNSPMTTASPVLSNEGIHGLDALYSMSYQLLGVLGIMTVLVVGTIVSVLTGGCRKGQANRKYLVPLFDKLCCCLPDRLLKWLHCGVDYDEVAVQDKETDDIQAGDIFHMTYKVDVDENNVQNKVDSNCDTVELEEMEHICENGTKENMEHTSKNGTNHIIE